MPLHIDLHVHSFFSHDGVSSPEEMIAAARARGLHGLALTDHNTCDGVDDLLRKGLMRADGLPVDGFLVIPGVEISTGDGHLLCLGVALPDARELKGLPALEVARIIHERGGLAVPPHPYDHFRAGIREGVLRTLPSDAIEVFNAATTLQSCNRRALDYAAARGLPMLSGSDAHHFAALGCAYTSLATEDFSVAGIVRQITQPGNALVQNPMSLRQKFRKTWSNLRLRWLRRRRLRKL